MGTCTAKLSGPIADFRPRDCATESRRSRSLDKSCPSLLTALVYALVGKYSSHKLMAPNIFTSADDFTFSSKKRHFYYKNSGKTDFHPKKEEKGWIYVLFCKKKVIFIKD